MNDLHLIADLLLAKLAWTAVVELLFKPVLFRLYAHADQTTGDRLPDLK
jgi:hypothetical protein